ncbi:DGQHR domain-containing protein DpdB [Nannocystaceae bacterium ST9]
MNQSSKCFICERMPKRIESMSVPALEVKQSRNSRIYTFAVDGKHVSQFAEVSRIKRVHEFELEGYQRPEVVAHIQEIREYIESDAPMVPNSVVIAFDSRVIFHPIAGKRVPTGINTRVGTLEIPLGEVGGLSKVGFVVDGQQRLAAIRGAKVKQFPVLVSAFITDDIRQQTEQFILVNATKPLPKGLIYELLPHTDARLPSALHRRRLAALLLERLNHDPRSPLHGMVCTPTSPDGVIRDNSMLKMLGNSLSDGLLYDLRVEGPTDTDAIEPMLTVLRAYWTAVKSTFETAWGLKPHHSRLMHGAGIVGVGNLMDHIAAQRSRQTKLPSQQFFRKHLSLVAPHCAWCSGTWQLGSGDARSWNQIQNTRQDVELLTDFLQRTYDATR